MRYSEEKIKMKLIEPTYEFVKENLPFSLTAKQMINGNSFIGYNHQYGVYNGLVWTNEQAEEAFIKDVQNAFSCYYKLFPQKQSIENTYQKYAIASIIMDISYEKLFKEGFFQSLQSKNNTLIKQTFLKYSKQDRSVCVKRLSKRNREFILFTRTGE